MITSIKIPDPRRKFDYPFWNMSKSNAYFHKVKKCIESCQTVPQLTNMKKFVVAYWENMAHVGLQGFVAIELKDFYNEKYKQLTSNHEAIACCVDIK